MVFFEPNCMPLQNSNWNPLSGGVKYTGSNRENLQLSITIVIYLGNDSLLDRPIVTLDH